MTSTIKEKVTHYVNEPYPKMVLARIMKEKKICALSIKELSVEKISNLYDKNINKDNDEIN